jgi:HlyD family secretion protein
MIRISRKRLIIIGVGALIVAAIVYSFLPSPVPVQSATVVRGPLQVIVEEEGETRLEDRYVITTPVAAYVQRIDLEVGDFVRAGQPVIRLEAPRAAILDDRTRAEAAARVQSARAAISRAEVVAANAAADRRRMDELHAAGAVSLQALEQATANLASALAARDAARAELGAAETSLRAARDAPASEPQQTLRAPTAGRVLAVHRDSEGHVSPGEPLVEVGDTERLRVAVDVLSQDAVRIGQGTPVMLEQWGGETVLRAAVTRVEPHGFTRVSALGVEERRVRVIADLVSPPQEYAGLGAGYRVLARFVVWEEPNVLQVPTAALLRSDEGWAVFVVEGGRAVLRPVGVGREAGLAVQILSGLTEGESVVVHASNEVADGVRVRAQPDR